MDCRTPLSMACLTPTNRKVFFFFFLLANQQKGFFFENYLLISFMAITVYSMKSFSSQPTKAKY